MVNFYILFLTLSLTPAESSSHFFVPSLKPHQLQNLPFENSIESDLFRLYEWDLQRSQLIFSPQLDHEDRLEKISQHFRKLNNEAIAQIPTLFKTNENQHSLSQDDAQNLLDHVTDHPIVGNRSAGHYDHDGGNVGFCFGRAAYVHMALLKMGVHPSRILKIFSMGGLPDSVCAK